MSLDRETFTQQWLRRFSTDAALFGDMSMQQLAHIYDALTLAIGAVDGVMLRCAFREGTEARNYLQRLEEALSDRRNTLVESLKVRPDAFEEDEVELYAAISSRYLAECETNAEAVEEFAADVAARYARLRVKEQ